MTLDRKFRPTGLVSPKDGDLLTRIEAGDEHAFEELYRSFRPSLTRFLINLTHRPHVVEEVLDDTMIAVWEKPGSFRGASKLSTWIFAIAYRKAMKALRGLDEPQEDRHAETREDDEQSPDDGIQNQQRARGLLDAMQMLSADHRAVVNLTYYHEMSYREIAEVMDCPVDTVKTRMFHARRRLKRLIAGEPADWI
jgi:RNA polymerase sigma-70 factor (ECF subfamily)